MTRLYKAFVVAFLMAFVSVAAVAQVTTSANDVATPIEGKGHDYIKMLSETVNPSNGSVSLRIDLPVPESRGFTVPFALTYDSSTAHHVVVRGANPTSGPMWTDNYSALSQGGWSYTIPQISWAEWDEPHLVFDGSFEYEHYANHPCRQSNGYTFRGVSGETHTLYMGGQYYDSGEPSGGCSSADNAGLPQARSEGDWSDGAWGILLNHGTDSFGTNLPDTRPQMVGDKHGFIYTFDDHTSFSTDRPGYWPVTTIPVSIEDRNGNKFTFLWGDKRGAFTATDTNGRAMYSSTSEFGKTGTINVGGKPYTLGWATQSAAFDVDHKFVMMQPSGACGGMYPSSDSPNLMTEIDLPRKHSDDPQLSYHFSYLGNSYGLLSEVSYPSGAWVRYTWKQSDTWSDVIVYDGYYCKTGWNGACYSWGPVPGVCGQQYKSPVVATREVGVAGSSTPILTQTFSYSTSWDSSQVSWTSKTTEVTTTDNVTGRSTLTVYTYVPKDLRRQPFDHSSTPPQAAVEQSIEYYEGATRSSRLLRRVEKDWADPYRLTSEKTTLEDHTTFSQKKYSYTGVMPSEVAEYDYNNSTTPVRRTVTTYQSFSGTLGTLLDKPCQTIVYDGSGNTVAQTDYHYDGGAVTCGTPGAAATTPVGGLPTGTHDEDKFNSSSSIPRGNLTEVIKKCSPNCSNPSPTTSYSYDSTGQIRSMIDPKGNTTQYSYADSSATNAFVTSITHPATDGGSLVESFTYDYQTSQLSTRTDPNGQTTTYTYDDRFERPTQIDGPGGAQTKFVYHDLPYVTNSPGVTTTKKLSSSQNVVSTSVTDGMGHVVRTIAESYPGGAMIVDMSYDGLGHLLSASNPHGSGASADGWTTYDYDALGRQTTLTHHPDNTTVQSQYDVNLTTVIDETGRQRKSKVDALGRLVEVTEPNPDTGSLTAGALTTSYTYDALNNLNAVLQNSSRPRSFTYDTLSQLRSATNPESGTITYQYDPNGNLIQKTAPSHNDGSSLLVTTSYGYDNLNRLRSKQYSDSATPSTCFQYQGPSGSVSNGAGHLINEWTQSGACPSTGTPPTDAISQRSFQSYDDMGGVSEETQCTPFNCNVGGRSRYSITHQYDFLGNEIVHTNGIGSISFTADYNGANLLRSLSSSWDDPTHPASLFSAPDATAYGPAGLTDAVFGTNGNGLNLHRTYDPRLRLASETDTGYLVQTASAAASALVQISGPEKSKAVPTASTGTINISGGTQAVSASGTVTINGTLQSPKQTQWTAAGTGSVSISGSEQSWQTQTAAATQSSGSVTISGSVQSKQVKTGNATPASTTLTIYNDSTAVYTEQCQAFGQQNCPTDYYNNATIYLDNQTTRYVNGGYGWADYLVVNNLASYLSSLNYDVYNRGNNTLFVTTRTTGAAANHTIGYFCYYDSQHFSSCPVQISGSLTLTGGHDDVYSTVSDSGATTIVVNGQTFSRSWSSGSTAASIAAGLASDINATSPYVSASVSGGTIYLASRQTGASTNYTLSASTSFNSSNFAASSFSTSLSSYALTGGKDATYATNYDSGTTTVVVNGHPTSYGWGGGSFAPDASSVAAGVAQAINSDGGAVVTASASGSTVSLTARSTGAGTNYSLSSATTSQRGSFSSTASAGALSGGKDNAYLYDSGTATVTVAGQPLSTSWSGSGTTNASIAAALAGVINSSSSYATAGVSGSTISLTARTKGSGTNYSLSAAISHNSGDFSTLPFTASPSGETLTGGSDQSPVTHDSGTAVLTVGGSSVSVPYGASDSSASIISKLASALGSCGGSAVVSGSTSGSTLSLTSCGKGASVNYPLSFTTSYDTGRYSAPAFTLAGGSSSSMSGGTDTGATVYDHGTVTLTINGVSGSANYGQNSTQGSVAAGLAAAFSGNSQVKVETYGSDSLRSTAKTIGTSGNSYTYQVSSSYDTANFSSASFSGPSSGSLSGGQDQVRARSAVYSYAVNYHGNGNVASANDSVMGAWSYPNDGYDALNRLTKGVSSSGPYSGVTINWSYDAWGNRLAQTPTSPDNGLIPYHWARYDENNRMTSGYERPETPPGYSYSSSGNLINDGRNQYTYDAENRIVAEGPASGGVNMRYVYNAEGQRVAKLNTTGAVLASYVLGLGGEQMTEMDASGNWKHTNVFAGGKLLATYDNQGLHFHANDWLGSRRIQTGYDGSLELAFRSLPFGDGLGTDTYASSGDSTEHHFTAKERDSETGNDYFGARYYSSNMGRFMSPDWSAKAEPVPYARLNDPQTLNLYIYVGNNPVARFDLDGHIDCTGKNASGVSCQFLAEWNRVHEIAKNVANSVYVKFTNGSGFKVAVGAAGVKVDIGTRRDAVDTKYTLKGKTATKIRSDISAKVDVGPSFKAGYQVTTKQPADANGNAVPGASETTQVRGILSAGDQGTNGVDVSLGSAGGCFILCAKIEVGVTLPDIDREFEQKGTTAKGATEFVGSSY